MGTESGLEGKPGKRRTPEWACLPGGAPSQPGRLRRDSVEAGTAEAEPGPRAGGVALHEDRSTRAVDWILQPRVGLGRCASPSPIILVKHNEGRHVCARAGESRESQSTHLKRWSGNITLYRTALCYFVSEPSFL